MALHYHRSNELITDREVQAYVRAAPRSDGAQWIAAVVSKLVVPHKPHTHAHAYVTGYNPQQGLRQRAFPALIGIGLNVPVTVLSDGGEDISHACQLPAAAERVLDWFHIGMLPISSAGAESAVDYVVGQRMKRNGHMRWSQKGATALLQVRCAVLNGQDVRNFVRWYPPDQRIQREGQLPLAA